MPRKHIDEFKAGFFVIAALVVVVGLVVWMGSIDIFNKPVSEAYLYSNASTGPQGLLMDSAVSVGDIKIGKISQISYDKATDRIIYKVSMMTPGYKLYANGQAKVASGFLGGSTVTISNFGDEKAGPTTPEKAINIRGGMAEIMDNFAVISDQLKQIVVVNRDSIDELIDNMVAVSANLNAASKEIRRNPWRLLYKPDEQKMRSVNIYDAARNFDSAATRLNIVVNKLKAVEQMDANDPSAQKELEYIQTELKKTFDRFQQAEAVFWKQISR